MLSKTLSIVVLSTTLSAYAQVASAPLSFQKIKLEAKSCHGKDQENKPICHESTVAYPKTGDRHLDDWVRKQFGGTLPTQRSIQTELDRSEDVKEVNQSNQQEISKGEYPCRLQFSNEWSLEGYTPNYAVFKNEVWEYQCGPHGNGTSSLTVLKRGAANPQSLKLEDILLPDQKAKLAQLLKDAYVQYLMERAGDSNEKETREYVTNEFDSDFQVTSDWTFDKKGLIFDYDIGELGSYAEGGPELTIEVKNLQGIIKPEILNEIEYYQEKPDD